MSRDVQFDEDKALWRYLDLPAEPQPAQESGVKLEEPDVQVQVQTQSTGSGGQRESGGHDPTIIEDELQQETDIQQPQQVETRPRPTWFRSTV